MRVLVTGASGMLGREVAQLLRAAGHLVLTPNRETCDITDSVAVHSYLSAQGPQIIVNCAGAIYGRRDEEMIAVNALGVDHLATASLSLGVARFVHISTDCVFSGLIGRNISYSIDDTPTPVDMYGVTKRAGELAALRAPHPLVLRTSFVGRAHGLMRHILDCAAQREPIVGWPYALWSGSTVHAVAAHVAHEAVGIEMRSGIHHLATATPISKHDLCRLIVQAFDLGVEVKDGSGSRANRSLEPTITLPPLKDALREMAMQEAGVSA